jgi:ATP-dependent Lon protease
MFFKNLEEGKQREYLKNIILSNIIYSQNNNKIDLLGSNELNSALIKLDYLYNQCNEDISINDIRNELIQIVKLFGIKNFEDFISIYFINNKTIYDQICNLPYYPILCNYFHILNFKEMIWKKNQCVGEIPKNKIVEDYIICEKAEQLECFDLSRNTSDFHLKVSGIKLALHDVKQKKTLLLYGNIDDICSNYLQYPIIKDKINSIESTKPDTDDFKSLTFDNYKLNITLRDLLVYNPSELHTKFMGFMNQIVLFKQKSINQIVKEFMALELYGQRNTLIQLILNYENREFQYLAYLLYDLLSNDNNSGNDSLQQKIIFDSLPWHSKKYFKEAMNSTILYTNNLLNYEVSQIPVEQQICLMKTDDSVKEKAMVKLKELKSKGDDNGSKARQYLDGLLKIPFGIYKKEPILNSSNEIFKLYSEIIKELILLFPDIPIIEEKNLNIVSISNYIINLKEKYLPEIKIKYMNQSTDLFKNMKRNELIYNINIINSLYKSHNIKKKKLIHSGKKSSFMHNQIISFINEHYNNKNILNEIMIKNNFKNLIIEKDFNYITDNINNEIGSVNEYMNNVRSILDKSVYGHDKAKKQIERIIGQWINGEQNGYCFGFEGPPGVGKTSLAKYGISQCLQDENGDSRPFSFIAIGGQDNGSCLNGHNYTYVGSEWGKLVDILIKNKCMNPIIFIDELDKVSKTEHGKEIIGILTHLVDSTQNDCFQDKYFNGIDLDFSKTLFIFSYNDSSLIDRILLDRIHRIKFEHLSLDEKIIITFEYTLPDIYKKMGINENIITLSKENIIYIIENYTAESGIRKLKEILFEIIGEINISFLKKSANGEYVDVPIKITNENIKNIYLKQRQEFLPTSIPKNSAIGTMNGLWANALGRGGIIPIEARFYPCNNFFDFKLTGMQGDVMKESMNVAKTLSWSLISKTQQEKILTNFEKTKLQGIHIHCPEGATPKDGPSAGTAITIALHSLLIGKKIKKTIAITGEINLQGNITAIGGLDLKVLGGIRAGVKEFIFPKDNLKDFNELSEKYSSSEIFNGITFHCKEHINDILSIVYEK